MNLASAAQMADVLTSIFTIFTLVYLALQIRASTASQRAESRRASVAATSSVLNNLVQSKDVARIWRLGLNNLNDIDPDEQIQFFGLLGLMMDAEMQRFTEHKLEILSEAEYSGNDQRNTFVDWLDKPGGLVFWKMHRKLAQRSFRDYIDGALQERVNKRTSESSASGSDSDKEE